MRDVKQQFAGSRHSNTLFLLILALWLLAPLAAAAAPNIVFLIAEDEYSANETLPKFARQIEEAYGFKCTIRQGGDNDLPGTEALKKADLAVIYIRRKVLPESQMKHIRNYVTSGKPVVGIRTASHAFSLRREEPEPGFFDWPEFDRDVLGGNYQGHTGHKADEEVITYVRAADGARAHPILYAVPKGEFAVPSWLYKTSPLAKTAVPLMTGRVTGMDVEEPVTWTNTSIYGGRVFYTSLGHPDEFKMYAFNRLLANGIFWALDMPSPKIATAKSARMLAQLLADTNESNRHPLEQAILKCAEGLIERNRIKSAEIALKNLLKTTKNQTIRKKAQQLLKSIK